MNYLLLPDFLAMSLLVAVLLAVRGHREDRSNLRLWIAGLMLILSECAARILYTLPGISRALHRGSHVVALDCYLGAGIVFLLSACLIFQSMSRRNTFVCLNGLPLLVLLSMYGLEDSNRTHFLACFGLAVACALVSPLIVRCSWWCGAAVIALWLPVSIELAQGRYRDAVYLSLGLIYAFCAFAFSRSLPKGSRGKFAVVTGFTAWSFCFFTHPWVARHEAQWSVFFSEVWNMQKFIITVGLLVVMLERQLRGSEWLALHDELTGLPNRRHFDESLQSALTRAERERLRIGLLTLDLDGLKQVNDTLGHDAGDILLRQVGEHLRSAAQPIGTVARLGGDEFSLIAILPTSGGSAEQSMARIQEALLQAMRHPVELGAEHGNQVVEVSASIGGAIFPDDAKDGAALMRLADARMYEQKSRRHNRRRGDNPSRFATPQAV